MVRSGADKGKTGAVLEVFPKTGMVRVEGVALRKKHQKSRREGQPGKIVDMHHAIHASKVTLTSAPKKAAPKAKKATKSTTK